eukprot:Gregarina_sp_Pseudo_9__1073@NODE_1699_length_1385_cov_1772_716939_g1575_i0_p1_GENE_NODE_1699_length_1385_cov_1772_716939_g1575_i0NODE_1699_length_1385_cov_1772_716939_g1575_i0_p1_ORF_typecomplete_len333_score19_40Integrin_beta/PF00362_18/1_8e21VWA/PF00092_28/0_00015VWA_2/PF13519_6/0_15_NODE_1699_length_1385_cov_1772_716939_g1575_i02021200
MKSLLFILAALSVDGETLMEIYGGNTPVPVMRRIPPLGQVKQDTKRFAKYTRTRAADHCTFPFDIIFVQDCTSTFADDWTALKETQLPLAIQNLQASHPGTRFGTILFQDKPVEPLGITPSEENDWYSDFCVRTNVTLSSDEDDILDLYRAYSPYGGGDVYESQFVSLLAASQLPFAWGADTAKLIVVVTDAPPHFDLDGFNPGLLPHTDYYDQENPEEQCSTQYYPSPDQVKVSIQNAGAYVAVLAYESGEMNNLTSKSWEWFVRHLEETDSFLKLMNEDSSNFWDDLSEVVAEVEGLECARHSTLPPPTPSPTQRPPHCPPCPTGACTWN